MGDLADGTSIANLGTGQPKSLREFAEEQWESHGAAGKLQIGLIPYRDNEIMRYVPNTCIVKGI